jgi:hypothetical protein
MKSRDLGVLLFGLAGLYSLLLALLGAAQLLLQLSAGAAGTAGSVVAAGGQLRIQAGQISGAVSVLLHLGFGTLLIGARRGLALWLLGDEEGRPAAAGHRESRGGEVLGGGGNRGVRGGGGARGGGGGEPPDTPAAQARGFAAIGASLLGVLLLARVVTALSYAASLLWLRGNAADVSGWTIAGILVDLLLAAAGALLIAARHRVAARLLAMPRTSPPAPAPSGKSPADRVRGNVATWQLPALRLFGLAVLVWYLPELASAASVFVKWWLRPMGFDLRTQAIQHIPPAATGVAAGLYLLLAYPAGLGPVARRLQPQRDLEVPEEPEDDPDDPGGSGLAPRPRRKRVE